MNALNKLINQKVIATIEYDEESYEIEGVVNGYNVNDFYFYEKGEPIYVTISINPIDEIPEDLLEFEFYEIPLENIRKA
ncbi:hypothetical protein F0365_05690 [Nonlabens sp. Ci31]|uniref:hypothetical protein n=1 Tax=Nonlabens sp. Ci31 TaxID=2608253 RepID=UPI0014635350|nr:hypothetical protein [Nonlabens sp. Ci31]QJP33931.1 hypothetical protein F0365_05690 [Nonlabens sp. Ci31]